MDRVLQSTASTISCTFQVDGIDTATTAVTVTITRADGTALVTGVTPTAGTQGVFTYTLTPTQTALLDTLTATWTGTIGSLAQTLKTTVQIVGGFMFTIAQARAIRPLNDGAAYSTASIVEMRTIVEQAIESELGYATVPRYTLEAISTWQRNQMLQTRNPYLRAIRAMTVNGTALTSGDLTALSFDRNGFISSTGGGYGSYGYGYGGSYGYGIPTGVSNVTLGYEHGLDMPSGRLQRAALLLAKVWLVAGPVDDRTNTFTSTEGGTFSLVTPGRGGSVFGVPEVDAAVERSRLVSVV